MKPSAVGPYSVPPQAIYIHVPFCEQKCFYCDFYTVTVPGRTHPFLNQWLELTARELDLWDAAGDIVTDQPFLSVFLGGGTPSLLEPERVGDFLRSVNARFGLADQAEVTLEVQPGTVDAGRLQAFADCGITRFSVGVQTFDPAILIQTGRRHTVAETHEALSGAKATGALLSLDLIAALPDQTLTSWKWELERALSYKPDHISVYELTFHAATLWGRQLKRGSMQPAHEDLRVEMFEWTEQALVAAGYEHYEVSNYARPGARSRHNENYWTLGNYVGLGAGAHSLIWPVRWENPGQAVGWTQSIQAGKLFRRPIAVPDPDLFLVENLWTCLRRLDGVDLAWFSAKIGMDPREGRHGTRLRHLLEEGLIRLVGDHLSLTSDGILRGDAVADYLI